MSSQFSSRPSSAPSAAPAPERVEVACESWEQFEQVFRRRLDSHAVFVPSVHPPPPGTQLEFRFSIPDGSSISIPAHVISSVPPPARTGSIPAPSLRPSPSGRPGMFVEFRPDGRASLPAEPEALDDAAMLEPPREDPELAISAALERMALCEYEEAIRLLVCALNADPDQAGARLLLNIAGARHARSRGESAIAADCYRAVLALQPDHPEAQRELPLLAPAQRAPVPLARVNLVERRVRRTDD